MPRRRHTKEKVTLNLEEFTLGHIRYLADEVDESLSGTVNKLLEYALEHNYEVFPIMCPNCYDEIKKEVDECPTCGLSFEDNERTAETKGRRVRDLVSK